MEGVGDWWAACRLWDGGSTGLVEGGSVVSNVDARALVAGALEEGQVGSLHGLRSRPQLLLWRGTVLAVCDQVYVIILISTIRSAAAGKKVRLESIMPLLHGLGNGWGMAVCIVEAAVGTLGTEAQNTAVTRVVLLSILTFYGWRGGGDASTVHVVEEGVLRPGELGDLEERAWHLQQTRRR